MNKLVKKLVKNFINKEVDTLDIEKDKSWDSILNNKKNIEVVGIKITIDNEENIVSFKWDTKNLEKKIERCVLNALNSNEPSFLQALEKEVSKANLEHLFDYNCKDFLFFKIKNKKIYIIPNFEKDYVLISKENKNKILKEKIIKKEFSKWTL